jgi:hypothetical protein
MFNIAIPIIPIFFIADTFQTDRLCSDRFHTDMFCLGTFTSDPDSIPGPVDQDPCRPNNTPPPPPNQNKMKKLHVWCDCLLRDSRRNILHFFINLFLQLNISYMFVTENLGLHPDPDSANPGFGSGFSETGSEKVLYTNGFINHT